VKLTEQHIRQLIREELNELGSFSYPSYHNIEKSYKDYDDKPKEKPAKRYVGFSSKEAKTIMDKEVKGYSKVLKKAAHSILKQMLALVKAGKVDYFDVLRSVGSGLWGRIDAHESDFIESFLHKNKIESRFRSYLKGKKSLPTRKWK
jgi:ABC-type molybdate transport system substrate-binding protein